MPAEPSRVGVGIVGLGNISGTYLRNLTTRFADVIEIIGCTDMDSGRIRAASEQYGVRGFADLNSMFDDPRVELIVNLTNPLAHAAVSEAAVAEGRHVYSEKPLTVDLADARTLLARAEAAGVLVGCAPDTFLGDGLQTCRRLVDSGEIGSPVAATAFMVCHGHENWHPAPAFFYQHGAGPMLDMGPYYLTAMVSLMGPISRVSGFERITFPTRTISSQPMAGRVIDVEVPTHVAGLLEFTAGPIATLVTTFDVWSAQVPHLEIYGTTGSLSAPDPNTFGGPVLLRHAADASWRPVAVVGDALDDSRGLGVADLARAIRTGGQPRASGTMACHVLEAMHGIHLSATTGRAYSMQTTCSIPAAR